MAKTLSPRRFASARNRPGIRFDRVEVDDIGVRRDAPRLMERDRLLDQARVAAAEDVEEHSDALRSAALFAQRQRDRGKDDQPAHHHLLGNAEAHQDEAVVEHAHEQRADERAEDRADAAVEPRAADDDGGDDGEEVGLAERIARAVQPAGIEQAGERRRRRRTAPSPTKRTRSTLMPTARALSALSPMAWTWAP